MVLGLISQIVFYHMSLHAPCAPPGGVSSKFPRSGQWLRARHLFNSMVPVSGTTCRRSSGTQRTFLFLKTGLRPTFLVWLLVVLSIYFYFILSYLFIWDYLQIMYLFILFLLFYLFICGFINAYYLIISVMFRFVAFTFVGFIMCFSFWFIFYVFYISNFTSVFPLREPSVSGAVFGYGAWVLFLRCLCESGWWRSVSWLL